MEMCRLLGWLDEDNFRPSPQAHLATLRRVHDPAYLHALKAASDQGSVTPEWRERFKFGTMENPLFPHVFERAATTVGGSILSAQLALLGHVVFHPAGGTHHGRPDHASGFCYFNDPVFALLTFLDAGLDRVLYVDVDAHHGDGVFDYFADEERVACISIHERDRWPNTGLLEDQSARRLNLPVPPRINDAEYELAWRQMVMPYVARLDPQAIVITCGADALAGDPLSHMELSNNALWHAVLELCALPAASVVLGGGGYNPWTTVRCWAGLWGLLSAGDWPDNLPEGARAIFAGFDSDLVDEDEVEDHWLQSLGDPLQAGEVRPELAALVQHLRAVHGFA
ncbi:MAG: hypothetical protein KDD98_03740 [Sphingomonadaceae bacterium]|nr:hypothetical protein [Sphingomonadaceae bacterium]